MNTDTNDTSIKEHDGEFWIGSDRDGVPEMYMAHDTTTGELIGREFTLEGLFQVCRAKGYVKGPDHISESLINGNYEWLIRYPPVKRFMIEVWNGKTQGSEGALGFRTDR